MFLTDDCIWHLPMVVLNMSHDLDNDVHVHLIVLLVDNNYPHNHHIVETLVDTLAFHDENRLVVVMVLVNMANET
jgi:hypothetical protein